MNPTPSSISPEESRKFPVTTLLVAIGILAAAAAILVFDVPTGTVLAYAFFGLMLLSHLFMHRAHGGHDHSASANQPNPEQLRSSTGVSQVQEHSHLDEPDPQAGSQTGAKKDPNSHQGHSGCC
jgi:hypothetical protein